MRYLILQVVGDEIAQREVVVCAPFVELRAGHDVTASIIM